MAARRKTREAQRVTIAPIDVPQIVRYLSSAAVAMYAIHSGAVLALDHLPSLLSLIR